MVLGFITKKQKVILAFLFLVLGLCKALGFIVVNKRLFWCFIFSRLLSSVSFSGLLRLVGRGHFKKTLTVLFAIAFHGYTGHELVNG